MKRLPLFSLLFLCVHYSFAQLVATHDTTICAGQHVQLSVTGGSSYTWTPSNTLSSSTSANPVATPTGNTSYIVSSPIPTNNIVVNGDFSQGNTGFNSSYTYEVPTNVAGSGSYFIGGSAPHWNSNMQNCSDHTSGVDTNMLIANGSLTAGTAVWCETLPVYPNATYNLSAYMTMEHNQNYPEFQWTVNGINAGSSVNMFPYIFCIWKNATATWSSGINTSATFCIVDPTIQGNGNDFAIDDISITGSGPMKDTVVVTVLPAPVVNLGNDTSVCTGQTLTFNAGNAGSTYLWSDNTITQTLAVNAAGTYAVTVTNSNNCSASDAVNVYSLDLTVTTASVNTTCGLNNGQASVSPDNGTSPFAYVWNTTATNDTISNLAGGTYTVTVHDAAGCSATGSAVVNTSGAGNVTIIPAQSQICAADSANICAPSGYNSYLWNTGATSTCIHPSLAGNYYVTVTDNANCSSTSNHVAVSVYPVPSVSVSVNGDTLSAFNANSYQWYLSGNTITGATDSVYIATQSGNYTVEITDSNGCKVLSNQLQVIAGINDLMNENLQVYPNPFANEVEVYGLQFTVNAELFDATGKRVFATELTTVNNKLKTENLQSGVYLLKIISGKKTYLKKLVKL